MRVVTIGVLVAVLAFGTVLAAPTAAANPICTEFTGGCPAPFLACWKESVCIPDPCWTSMCF